MSELHTFSYSSSKVPYEFAHEGVLTATKELFGEVAPDELVPKLHLVFKDGYPDLMLGSWESDFEKAANSRLVHMLEPLLDRVHVICEAWQVERGLYTPELTAPVREQPDRQEVLHVVTYHRSGNSVMTSIPIRDRRLIVEEAKTTRQETTAEGQLVFFANVAKPN